MTTASNHLFETVILTQTSPLITPATAETRNTRSVVEMPTSLWRHAQNEEAAETRHHQTAGRVLAGTAILSLGSVAYAICQTWTLLSGGRLHDAVAAFLR
ncbi:MAG: hypothetical protein INR62_01955 [Rhodospirillales bacterium]|nr:hypothetical protein [Acetobacter sp.]